METYVVLLRGINVGGKNIVPMKPLVQLLTEHGFEQVKYYIQSGNLILTASSDPTVTVKLLIESEFNVTAEVLTLTVAQFTQAIENNPFQSDEGKTIHFFFCQTNVQMDEEKIENLKADSESYIVSNNVFYLHAPDGIGRSKLAAKVEACLQTPVTARNLNTIIKIANLLA